MSQSPVTECSHKEKLWTEPLKVHSLPDVDKWPKGEYRDGSWHNYACYGCGGKASNNVPFTCCNNCPGTLWQNQIWSFTGKANRLADTRILLQWLGKFVTQATWESHFKSVAAHFGRILARIKPVDVEGMKVHYKVDSHLLLQNWATAQPAIESATYITLVVADPSRISPLLDHINTLEAEAKKVEETIARLEKLKGDYESSRSLLEAEGVKNIDLEKEISDLKADLKTERDKLEKVMKSKSSNEVTPEQAARLGNLAKALKDKAIREPSSTLLEFTVFQSGIDNLVIAAKQKGGFCVNEMTGLFATCLIPDSNVDIFTAGDHILETFDDHTKATSWARVNGLASSTAALLVGISSATYAAAKSVVSGVARKARRKSTQDELSWFQRTARGVVSDLKGTAMVGFALPVVGLAYLFSGTPPVGQPDPHPKWRSARAIAGGIVGIACIPVTAGLAIGASAVSLVAQPFGKGFMGKFSDWLFETPGPQGSI